MRLSVRLDVAVGVSAMQRRQLHRGRGAVQRRAAESRPTQTQVRDATHIRDTTTSCFNVRSKADISQLHLPHGTDNNNTRLTARCPGLPG